MPLNIRPIPVIKQTRLFSAQIVVYLKYELNPVFFEQTRGSLIEFNLTFNGQLAHYHARRYAVRTLFPRLTVWLFGEETCFYSISPRIIIEFDCMSLWWRNKFLLYPHVILSQLSIIFVQK